MPMFRPRRKARLAAAARASAETRAASGKWAKKADLAQERKEAGLGGGEEEEEEEEEEEAT